MALNYSASYIAALEDTTRYRLDTAARPIIAGKAMAQQLVSRIEVEKLFGRFENVPALQAELRPLLSYLD